MNTEIRIRGMGGVINFEMMVIQKALEATIEVTVAADNVTIENHTKSTT